MAPDIGGEETDPTHYMLPVVPESLGIDPLLVALVQAAAFFDLADDDLIDPDAAGDVLEHIGLYVQRLPEERRAGVKADLEALSAHANAQGWPTWVAEFCGEFLYSCGIGEDRAD